MSGREPTGGDDALAADSGVDEYPDNVRRSHADVSRNEVLTVDELATLLRVDRKTVYTMIAGRKVPGVRRCGRAIRIHRQTVVDWLADGQDRVAQSRKHR